MKLIVIFWVQIYKNYNRYSIKVFKKKEKKIVKQKGLYIYV
jgi:hypothetical protein